MAMNPYWLDFGRYNIPEREYESFGHIIIEVPMNLPILAGSNQADMSAVLSAKDMDRLDLEFDTRGKSPRPRFYLGVKRPGKFECPCPPTFKTENGYEVWVTRQYSTMAL
jgi:hypothetical protein